MTIQGSIIANTSRTDRILSTVPLAMAAMVFLAPAVVHAGGGGAYKPSDAVSFEEIPGSAVKRVILVENAAERLGIEVGEVSEQVIVLNQIVGGDIVPPLPDLPEANLEGSFSGFGPVTQAATAQNGEAPQSAEVPQSNASWVRVTLSQGEWERMRKGQPARILPLPTRGDLRGDVFAIPSGLEPILDMKRSMLRVYYILPEGDHGLEMYERVRVELQLADGDERRIVVPYSAVYYDGQGVPWVYTTPESLVFVRQRIEVERIVGDFAVITDGPPIGTKVVTVGAPLLYGAEVIYKR